jgi:5-methylcytosine-specific restriction protein A
MREGHNRSARRAVRGATTAGIFRIRSSDFDPSEGRIMAWNKRGTRQQQGYGRAHELMREHLLATVIVCEHCSAKGRTTPGHIADHIIPLSKGGTHARSNYQLLCRECAKVKDAKDRGRPLRKRPRYGLDGFPIEED